MVKLNKAFRKIGKEGKRITLGSGKTLATGGRIATQTGKIVSGAAPLIGAFNPEYGATASQVGGDLITAGRLATSTGRIGRQAARNKLKKRNVANLEKNVRKSADTFVY